MRFSSLAAIWGVAYGEDTLLHAECKQACGLLSSFPLNLNITNKALPGRYWANQVQQTTPACFAYPTTAQDVSSIIKIIGKYQCPFAISGGGHSDNPGANNLANGITIDLGLMKQVTVSADGKTTSVGPGNRWGEVYSLLDPRNLTVVGGREAQVGVPGLLLGGGISYFSGLYGLALDNVRNLQVVLANGTIVNTNDTSSTADLFKAFRGGGGNNFGVVTRLDLDSYPQGLMHGGLTLWKDSPTTTRDLIKAYAKYSYAASNDPNAALFVALVYNAGSFSWSAGLDYAKPISKPKIFEDFRTPSLEAVKTLDTSRITPHTGLALELGLTQPGGRRQQFNTATFRVNEELLQKMTDIYREEVARVLKTGVKSLSGLSANFALQPLTARTLALTKRRGGNVLGLQDNKDPLCILSMSWPWDSPEDDDLIQGAMGRIVDRSVALAKQLGLHDDYIYMNYARSGDQVIAGYGQANVNFLRTVSRKYDPTGIFQRLAPGGFKLPSS